MRALGEKESAAFETPVAEIMTRKVVFCSRHDKLVDLMQRMTDGKFRHLPVIEDGRLIGIVSIGDVVESRLEELEQGSDTLREYIHRRAHHKGMITNTRRNALNAEARVELSQVERDLAVIQFTAPVINVLSLLSGNSAGGIV